MDDPHFGTRPVVDLVAIGGDFAGDWPLGRILAVAPTPTDVAEAVSWHLTEPAGTALLFWDISLGMPDPEVIASRLTTPVEVWHAGLALGMAGQPPAIDYVAPHWMHAVDPPRDIVASSWRISLRACLVRSEVLRQGGGPNARYDSLHGSAVELGHRWFAAGAIMRHDIGLLPDPDFSVATAPTLRDGLQFILDRYGKTWLAWCVMRMALAGEVSWITLSCALRRVRLRGTSPAGVLKRPSASPCNLPAECTVSVIIPTIDRYPYVRTLLEQLGSQTVPPREIFIVDQTDANHAQWGLAKDFPGLPIRYIWQDRAGQCTSRNQALREATCSHILLLDDDVEIEHTLIEDHLRTLISFGATVSSGVVHELDETRGAPEPGPVRTSAVFPAGNSMAQRKALQHSGLFDLAYDRGERADGDLGMRLYLAGELMVLNPTISILHHRAPRGGLRTYGARTVTYRSSRRRLWHRQLPRPTEIYLAYRYLSARQTREMLWIRVFRTLFAEAGHGQLAKALVGLGTLPHSAWVVWRNVRLARRLLAIHPTIPELPPDGGVLRAHNARY